MALVRVERRGRAVTARAAERQLTLRSANRRARVGREAAGRLALLLGQTRKKSPDTFSSSGRHPGAAAVIRPIVHDRAAFGLRFFPYCQPRHSFRCQPHSIPLERQLRFRRALRLFPFGNIHSPGGASCQDCGGFLTPLSHCFGLQNQTRSAYFTNAKLNPPSRVTESTRIGSSPSDSPETSTVI